MMRRILIAFFALALIACAAAEPPYNWRTDKLSALHLANRTESTSATLTKTWYDTVATDDADEEIDGYWLFTDQPDLNAGIGFASGAESITYNGGLTEFVATGPFAADNFDSGQGNTEIYDMNQDMKTSDEVAFGEVAIGTLEHRTTGLYNTSGGVVISGPSANVLIESLANDILFQTGPSATTERMRILNGGGVKITGNTIILTTAKTPSSASDTGTTGTICWDSSFLYVAVGTDTWKRAALSNW